MSLLTTKKGYYDSKFLLLFNKFKRGVKTIHPKCHKSCRGYEKRKKEVMYVKTTLSRLHF